MSLTLAQLAAALDAELRGDGDMRITGMATLKDATSGQLSFLANGRYRRFLAATRASAVILNAADADAARTAVLICDDPYVAYARAARLLHPAGDSPCGIHADALVDPGASVDAGAWIGPGTIVEANARIGNGVFVGPACVIGAGVSIGADSRLVARVTLLAGARIGQRVLLHPGVVIGSDGFGMAQVSGRWEKIPQLGGVRIGDDVEIGANTTVDRGALGDTVIEEGVKIDNQVQVAHNVHIGAHSAIAGCVGISGSTRIGRHCTLAGGVGVVGHLDIADHVHITGMSMVTHSIRTAGTYSAGTPLMENRLWRLNAARFKQLDRWTRWLHKFDKINNIRKLDK